MSQRSTEHQYCQSTVYACVCAWLSLIKKICYGSGGAGIFLYNVFFENSEYM